MRGVFPNGSSGGDWSNRMGPDWERAPKLRNIAADRGAEGAILWGIDPDYRTVMNWQDGKGEWYGWSQPNWLGAPHSYELTAAAQNDNCAQLWAVTLSGKLSSIAQTAPSCNWQGGTQFPGVNGETQFPGIAGEISTPGINLILGLL